MGLNARHLIIEGLNHDWQAILVESLLEIAWHVISNLSNAVQGCISNLWVSVLNVLQDGWDHGSNLLNVIDVLSHLGEGHDTSVLVPPVRVVCDSCLHKDANQGQHGGLTDTSNKSVDSLLTKADVVFFLILASEALLWLEPVVVNVLINVDHELEDQLEDVLGQLLVFLREAWLSLDHSHDELHWLVTDRVVSKFLVCNYGLEGLVEGLKICTEKVWLNLCKLIELDESVLKNRLVLLSKGLGHDLRHEGQQLDELLRVLALRDGQVVGKSLQGSNLNVQFLKVQCSLENATKLLLVLYQVVHNVAKEAVEDEKRRVNLCLVLSLNECEQQVEQVLPDGFVLFLDHGALDFHSHIAHLVD